MNDFIHFLFFYVVTIFAALMRLRFKIKVLEKYKGPGYINKELISNPENSNKIRNSIMPQRELALIAAIVFSSLSIVSSLNMYDTVPALLALITSVFIINKKQIVFIGFLINGYIVHSLPSFTDDKIFQSIYVNLVFSMIIFFYVLLTKENKEGEENFEII